MKFTNQQLGPVPLVNVVVPLKRSLGDRATFKTTLSEGEGGEGGGVKVYCYPVCAFFKRDGDLRT